jgi:hypothetical protein
MVHGANEMYSHALVNCVVLLVNCVVLLVNCVVLLVNWKVPGRVTGDFFQGIRQFRVPGVDSAFRNKYQDIPGGKDGRCLGLTTLPP